MREERGKGNLKLKTEVTTAMSPVLADHVSNLQNRLKSEAGRLSDTVITHEVIPVPQRADCALIITTFGEKRRAHVIRLMGDKKTAEVEEMNLIKTESDRSLPPLP